jgi:quinolinate synthase
VVLVHPECPLDTIEEADEVLSTGGMCAYVRTSSATRFIIATELGIIHRLKKENPRAEFIPVSNQAICPNMKRIQMEDVLRSLKRMEHPIELSEEVRRKAELPLRRMLAGRIE